MNSDFPMSFFFRLFPSATPSCMYFFSNPAISCADATGVIPNLQGKSRVVENHIKTHTFLVPWFFLIHIFLYVWGAFLWVVIAKTPLLFKGNPERSFCFNDEWSSSGFLYEFFLQTCIGFERPIYLPPLSVPWWPFFEAESIQLVMDIFLTGGLNNVLVTSNRSNRTGISILHDTK